jgi:hypothetical protein
MIVALVLAAAVPGVWRVRGDPAGRRSAADGRDRG